MFCLVVLGFILGVLVSVPITLIVFGFGMVITAQNGKTYMMVGDMPKWVGDGKR
jgi:hypothetical protein